MRPFVVIPAKASSERLPRKNLALLGGRPLVSWAIETALAADLPTYVTSEHPDILAIAEQAGATPILRPPELSSPGATVADVLGHAVKLIDADPDDAAIVLLPSSPFRRPETLQQAYALFAASNKDALLSVSPMTHPPEWVLRDVAFGRIYPSDVLKWGRPRTALRAAYFHDGAYHVLKVRRVGNSFVERTMPFPTPFPESVDINTPEDLTWAEYLLATGQVPWIAPAAKS